MNTQFQNNNPASTPLMLHVKPKYPVQPKLTVNTPGDIYEQEADAMADKVMRMSSNEVAKPVTGLIGKSLQRKCTHCEEEEKRSKPIMRKAEGGNAGLSVSSSFASSLSASKGGGSPIPKGTRSFMENAFSADFSSVKIHTDCKASEMSKGINSKAFTYGNDIYFNDGQYHPSSNIGKQLLAHELTHVVQQKSSYLTNSIQKTPTKDEPRLAQKEFERQINQLKDQGYLNDDEVEYYLAQNPKFGRRERHRIIRRIKLNRTELTIGELQFSEPSEETIGPSEGLYLGVLDLSGPGEGLDLGELYLGELSFTDPSKDWETPTSGVIQAWMYNQIDNWHTGATQGLTFFKDAVLEESSVGFWLGLAGNLVWAIGAMGAPIVATTVGLTGLMIGSIGSRVQADRDQKASDTVSSIYENYLSGFNDARSQMNAKVISETTRIMKLPAFNETLSKKDHAEWQQFIKSEANLPEGTDVNMIRKNIEQNLYRIYLKDKGAYVSKSNFSVPSPHYPGGTTETKHINPHNIPDKVLGRLEKLGIDWRYMSFLEIPQRIRELVPSECISSTHQNKPVRSRPWDYTESTIFPLDWTQDDKDNFYKKVPSWMVEIVNVKCAL